MWVGLALLSALFQVLRNMSMKHLGRSLDDTINVWGRFTFLLPFVGGFVLWQGIPLLRPGFWLYVVLFGAAQTAATLSLAKALRLSDISIVTALWKVSLLFLVIFAFLSLGEMPSLLGFVGVLVKSRRMPSFSGRESLVGMKGTTRSHLDPRGVVLVQGERWDAVADADDGIVHVQAAGQQTRQRADHLVEALASLQPPDRKDQALPVPEADARAQIVER